MTPEAREAVTRDRIDRARLWLIPCTLLWTLMGTGTLHGLAGRPQDAPHLLIPQGLRATGWILSAITALAVLLWDRHHREAPTRVAAALLLVMPLTRALSYSLAGIYAVVDLDGAGGLDGSPDAYYTADPWWALSLAILTQAVNWRRLARNFVARVKAVWQRE